MSVRHHLALTGAQTLRTTPLALTERAVRDIVSAQAMGVIHGPAGCGKTFAWQSAVAQVNTPVCAVAVPQPPEHAARRARPAAQAHRHRTEGQPL